MAWNWQRADWPNFTYDSGALRALESKFLLRSGELIGACKHVGADDQATLKIELIGEEAVKTSQICVPRSCGSNYAKRRSETFATATPNSNWSSNAKGES